VTRPLRATVDLEAIRHNARLASGLAPASRLLAVVKADAYGHGARQVVAALDELADGFAVASVEEAEVVRRASPGRPILLLEGVYSPDELAAAGALGLDVVVHSPRQVAWLAEARLPHPLRTWLELDSGMHRMGFPPAGYRAAYERLDALPGVSEIVLMTHFGRADETDADATTHQIRCFDDTTTGLSGARSLANSAGVVAWPASHGDWTRPGIMLYGCEPLFEPHPATRGLRPAMELTAEVIAVRDVAAGQAVGYGARFVADRPSRIGVVSVGYGDGYPRHAPDGTPILVDGARTRLAGRVSMDVITVDLTDLPASGIGSPVELWGRRLPADEVASAVGTIAYELVTRVAARVPRVYRS